MEPSLPLPFRADSTLRSELRDVYLCEALEWLISSTDGDSDSIKSVANDNPWETAYCVITILRSRQYLLDTSSYRPIYDQKVEHAIQYLISKVQGDDERISLDKNPYDTSLTIQALLLFCETFPLNQETKKIRSGKIIIRALKWVLAFLGLWLVDRTVGELDDIAQCLIAVMMASQASPSIKMDKEGPLILHHVINELLILNAEVEEQNYSESIYVSSYVLIALLDYLNAYPNTDLRKNIVKTIRYEIAALEKRFLKNWDQPPDTALALQLYILVASDKYIEHDSLPEIIFQSFRWLCDPKQRYQNGSIQRSVHYTALFTNSIIAALGCSKIDYILDKLITLLYDYILGQTTYRETLDRSAVARLRLDIQQVKENHEKSIDDRDKIRRSLNIILALNIWVLAIIFFFLSGIVSQSLIFETKDLKFFAFTVLDWQVLLIFATIIFPGALAITNFIKKH
jgi:hypothetical protein